MTAVPLTILTGFLGAGKTTLLNRILEGDHGLRVAVLVNDFGSINIDADLVVGVDDNTISLANGCVCCEIRNDLLESITDLLARPEQPEYIMLEASGVADPAGICLTFENPDLRDRVRIDSITAVVDAEQAFAYSDYPAVTRLRLRQIAFADMTILNKVDLAGPTQMRRVRAWLDEHFHRVHVIEASFCDVPYEVLLGVGRFDPVRAAQNSSGVEAHDAHGGTAAAMFSTWSYQTDVPLSLDALREVASQLPGTVYRCKGVVFAAEAPDRRAVLQVVGRRVDLRLLDEWNGRPRATRVVAIGAPHSIDACDLRRRFDACAAHVVGANGVEPVTSAV